MSTPPRDPFFRLWPLLRDVLIFMVGLGGIIYETVLVSSPNASLLVLFAAMIGLPTVLRKDER